MSSRDRTISPEAEQIDGLLRRVFRVTMARTKSQLSTGKADLTAPQYHTLRVLGRLESPRMSDLHREMGVAKSTLTTAVDYLVRSGHVERYRTGEDRRVVLLRLTSKGTARLREISEKSQAFLQKGLSALGRRELLELTSLLQRLLAELEAEIQEPEKRS